MARPPGASYAQRPAYARGPERAAPTLGPVTRGGASRRALVRPSLQGPRRAHRVPALEEGARAQQRNEPADWPPGPSAQPAPMPSASAASGGRAPAAQPPESPTAKAAVRRLPPPGSETRGIPRVDPTELRARLKEHAHALIEEVQSSFQLPPHEHENFQTQLVINSELAAAVDQMVARMHSALRARGMEPEAVVDLGGHGLVSDDVVRVALEYARVANLADPSDLLRRHNTRGGMPVRRGAGAAAQQARRRTQPRPGGADGSGADARAGAEQPPQGMTPVLVLERPPPDDRPGPAAAPLGPRQPAPPQRRDSRPLAERAHGAHIGAQRPPDNRIIR